MSNERKQRTYEKASYKTKPYTVRFDIEKFDFFMKRQALKSAQQLVDFFLNEYWWKWKVPVVTAKEAPPLSLKMDKIFDAEVVADVSEEPLKFDKPKIAIKRTPAHWVELRRDCQNADDYAKWLEDLENDKFLTPREVREIKATV